MCGIAGYLKLAQSHGLIDEQLLQNMQKSIVHRGPDGHGVWKSDEHGVGLAHRRLSIIDLSSAGAQPMQDKEETVVVSFNGEIYNHQALRADLEKRGYSYFSSTDTETLIYAYKEWGIGFLDKLEGMFAIALFDKQKDELYLIRDRIGIKPLYFSPTGGMLSFASEIKALWELPWLQKKTNVRAFYHYLTFMATPAPMTLYDGIYKLPAGFYAKVDAQRNLTFHEWYDPLKVIAAKPRQKEFEDENFCVENIRTLLRDSVKKRMMSDVPVGVFLSGGIDSSLNVALMSEVSTKVKTFNVVFEDFPENDESMWAKKVSQHFGTEHHEILISEKDAFDFFEKMVYHQDEPLADCVCIPLYYVSKLAKESGVTVVQVGEGSDELFCGYSAYARYLDVYHRYWRSSQRVIPKFVRQSLFKTTARLFPNKKWRLDQIKNWAYDKNLFWGGAIAFSEFFKKDLLPTFSPLAPDPIISQIYPQLDQNFDSYAIVDHHLSRSKKENPSGSYLDSMIYLELKQRLPELLLMRVDKMAMATSLEGRVPFLDHKLVEFALQIPASLKYHNGMTKYILKKACEGILPHDVIYRKKMGFAAPTSGWFRKGTYFPNLLTQSLQCSTTSLIHKTYVTKLLDEHRTTNAELSVQLWTLQNVLSALKDAK